jgi:hypothetical protein
MNSIECRDRERILCEGGPEQLAGLEQHARGCAGCAEALRQWNDISEAARTLSRSHEPPDLWPKIREALAKEARPGKQRERARWLRWPWPAFTPSSFAVATVLLTVTGWAVWTLIDWPAPRPTPEVERRLLAEPAVREVEKAEAGYAASIQKLSALAQPKIANPTTPLLADYREKLLLLDAAIADCRTLAAQNRANPQLRQALLSLYREKKQTLEAVVQEE